MKNVFLAAALATTTTAASAGDLAFLGGLDYTVEAEVLEATVGVEYAPEFAAGVTITPVFAFNDAGQEFAFDAASITLGYALDSAVNAYVTIDADKDLNRTETTVGLAFRF